MSNDLIDTIKDSANNKKRYLRNNSSSHILFLDEKGNKQMFEIKKEIIVSKAIAENLLKFKNIVDITDDIKKKFKEL